MDHNSRKQGQQGNQDVESPVLDATNRRFRFVQSELLYSAATLLDSRNGGGGHHKYLSLLIVELSSFCFILNRIFTHLFLRLWYRTIPNLSWKEWGFFWTSPKRLSTKKNKGLGPKIHLRLLPQATINLKGRQVPKPWRVTSRINRTCLYFQSRFRLGRGFRFSPT